MENTKQRFEEFKRKILTTAQKAGICTTGYQYLYNAKDFAELCDIIKANLGWCCKNGVLIGTLIDEYSVELGNYGIWHDKSVSSWVYVGEHVGDYTSVQFCYRLKA